MTAFSHVTVLLEESVAALRPADGEVYVDCTLGGGGHTEALLRAADCTVLGIDRDPAALQAAGARLAGYGDRFVPVHAAFSELPRVLEQAGRDAVDGVLADLGVSSPQLDDHDRGFSFHGHPLDMRMDTTQSLTAAEVVNEWDQAELVRIIRAYGEEPRARAIARTIVAGRPWTDASAMAEAIRGHSRPGRVHPATRTFQAIRIAVNDELGELDRLLPAALESLRPCGRLAIIAFHSLEDRRVKQFLARESGRTGPRDPWGDPVIPPRLSSPPRPVLSPPDEPNPRARSARLRTAVRLPCPAS